MARVGGDLPATGRVQEIEARTPVSQAAIPWLNASAAAVTNGSTRANSNNLSDKQLITGIDFKLGNYGGAATFDGVKYSLDPDPGVPPQARRETGRPLRRLSRAR